MAFIEIDGIGKVEPDASFFQMAPHEQARAVDDFVKQYQARQQAQQPPEANTLTDANAVSGPAPDELAFRGDFLPVGKTKSGDIVPALPKFLEGPRQTIMDLIEGKRTADQISGKEVFDLGGLFAGASPAAGSGKAIAQAAGRGKNKLPGAAPVVTEPVGVETAGMARTIAKNVGDIFQNKTQEKPDVLSTPEIKAASQALYKAADESGIVIKNETFRSLAGDIITSVRREGFDKDIQPKVAAALRRFQSDVESGANPTLSQMDILRQVVRGAATSADSNERRIARTVIGKIDGFMRGLTPNDVIGGDTANGPQLLAGARQLWSQKAKGEQIDEMFNKALNNTPNYNASGFENALKNQFKSLANNPNRMRQFDAQEQEAILNVVRGDDTQAAMRKLGKFSPTAGFFAGVLSGEIALHALENPKLLAVPIIGGIARAIATARTNSAATKVSEMVRGGPAFKAYLEELAAQRAGEANTFGSALQRSAPTLAGQIFGQK